MKMKMKRFTKHSRREKNKNEREGERKEYEVGKRNVQNCKGKKETERGR